MNVRTKKRKKAFKHVIFPTHFAFCHLETVSAHHPSPFLSGGTAAARIINELGVGLMRFGASMPIARTSSMRFYAD
jgi:hypothetical protein